MSDKKTRRSATTNLKPAPEIIFHLPPGVKFGDVYMDAPELAQELNLGKRTISNLRNSGKLSFTRLSGKLYYFRQEIAEIMELNKRKRKS